MADEMIIFSRTFDMLAWLLPKSERFPRAYRSTMTQRMMGAALDFHEALNAARNQGGSTRERHLRAASAHLDSLRLYLRLAERWGWITKSQHQHASAMLAEIGRLLGGWQRASTR